MAKKQAKKRVKKAVDNPHGKAKAKILKAKEKFRRDQVKYFDELRKKRSA